MKYVDEFRDPEIMRSLVVELARITSGRWKIMEVCGGQTHTIARYGIEKLAGERIEIVHGPGCPVCVTPVSVIDAARQLAVDRDVVLCTFGDMLRVPGTGGDLLDARSLGGDVRVVHSPLEAVEIAVANPERQIAMLAVGFETTAPATAMAVVVARDRGVANVSLLACHVRVPPAIALILEAPGCDINGFLAAGHVCTVAGIGEYPALSERFGVPISVTGFEPVDILYGLLDCVGQLETGRAEVTNRYRRAVATGGNPHARKLVDQVYRIADRPWRGLGIVPGGGLALRDEYASVDAAIRHDLELSAAEPDSACRAAEILQGRLKPDQCPEFGQRCTPESPLGAPMVSTEGACAAYFRYRPRVPA